jgi:structural maintenance of chromosome 2
VASVPSKETLLLVDKELAATLAFDKGILTKCITKDGDVYDPAGTMTGGSAPGAGQAGGRSSSMLVTLARLSTAESALSEAIAALAVTKRSLEELQTKKRTFQQLQQDLDLGTHALALLKDQLVSDPAAQALETRSRLTAEVTALETSTGLLLEQIEASQAKVADYTQQAEAFRTTTRTGQVVNAQHIKDLEV